MFIIPNSIDNKLSTTTTIFVNTNIISLVVHLFLAEKNARIGVFWPQFRFLEHQYLSSNVLEDAKPLAQ